MTAQLARVRRVLSANRRLADPTDALGAEARERLPEITHLSPRGVSLALEHHLEVVATDDDLAALVASVAEAPRVHVVLSANVFTASSRALALALASSPRVVVRPSRREPVFAELLLRALDDIPGEGELVLAEGIAPEAGDHVHAYGRDATLRTIQSTLPAGVSLWGHGTGLGVAAVGEGDVGAAAEAVAADVVAFDQRGCLSPRIALVAGGEDAAVEFGRSLAAALKRYLQDVPLGEVDAAERASLRSYVQTIAVVGRTFGEPGALVGVDLSPRALLIADAPRCVHVVHVRRAEDASALLAPIAAKVAALGGTGSLADSLSVVVPLARRSALGAMQRPPLDGPVDRRAPAPRSR